MDFKHLKSINQNISEALFRSSEEGLIYANRAYSQMFGFANEEEAIRTPNILVYKNPDDRAVLIRALIKDGHYKNQEIKFVRRDGTEFIGLVSTVLFQDRDGKVFWDGSIRDITEQRKMIGKLLDREQLLNSINKNINEAIYRSVNRGGLIYVNEEFIRMFGYRNESELMALNVEDLYKNPDDRDVIGDAIVSQDSISNQEVEFKRKDGTTFWGYLNSIKVVGSDGEIYFDGAIRDITKEKAADEMAQKQAEMQELLIYISSSLINLPVDEIDQATVKSLQGLGEFVGADRTYIFGFDENYSADEVYSWVKKGIDPLRSGEDDAELHKQIGEHFKGLRKGKYLLIKNLDEMQDGPLKQLYQQQKIKTLLNVPILNNGKCVGCVGFDWVRNQHEITEIEILLLQLFSEMYTNIKERSFHEHELRKLFTKTVEQNQRLKDFSYITSHNFRSSVANLMGLITILDDDRSNDEFFVMMKETALKLNLAIDSINDLLNFEKDISALEKEDCNIFQTISDILILNKKTSKEKDISFQVDVPKDLTIKVLPAYLQSILHNLITNAMKYGVTPEKRNIFIKAEKVEELVLLSVADEGVGIDMKRYGEKLFRLGSRFHAGMDSGHGMGLYITKQQIEAIGGRVEVESTVNKGTKFKVYLDA